MKEKNRFSSLLKHLMTIADVKNYALAKELQFDESYVSKMISGSLMPPKKTCDKVLRSISRCIVHSLDTDSRKTMMSEYQIIREKDLEAAIYDNLMAEYNYVVGLKEETGSEIAQKTVYFPELTLAQFMQKTRHPVLRQVKSLDVIAAMDILALDRHYQLALAELESSENVVSKNYPNVHFSMLINLDANARQNTYNVTFLLNLLTNLSDIDFQLYTWPQAVGKILFTVRDAYSVAGMVMDENHCISVTTTEDAQNCNAIYDRLRSLCSSETMIVRKVAMEYMLDSNDYVRFLLGRNQRWLLGHVTEHIVPEELFEALAPDYCATHDVRIDDLRRIHGMIRSVIERMGIRMLLCERALMDFAVSGEVDFFNQKILLTPDQRLNCLEHLRDLAQRNGNLSIRVLRPGAVSDIQHIPEPTMFLSESLGYLRLVRSGPENNLSVVNKMRALEMMQAFFDEVWSDGKYRRVDNLDELICYVVSMINVQIQG